MHPRDGFVAAAGFEENADFGGETSFGLGFGVRTCVEGFTVAEYGMEGGAKGENAVGEDVTGAGAFGEEFEVEG